MAPKYTRQQFMASDENQKKQILDEQARSLVADENKKIDRTFAAQTGKMDKIYMSLYYAIKKDAPQYASRFLSDEEKFDLGVNSRTASFPEEDRKSSELDTQTIHAIVPEPTLENFRAMYFYLGMIQAKSSHDLAKEQKKIKASLSDDYDEETKTQLSETLAKNGGCMSNMIDNYANTLIQSMGVMKVPGQTVPVAQQQDYDATLNVLLRQDMETKLGNKIPPAMTVAQYLDLIKAVPEDRASFMKAHECKNDDTIYDVFAKQVDGNNASRLTLARIKDPDKRTKTRHGQIIDLITEDYAKKMPKVWGREGTEAYKKGLQRTELKEYEDGERIKSFDGYKHQLKNKGINYDALETKMLHDNVISNHQIAVGKVTGEKRLDIRHEAGFSDAISADIPQEKKDERLKLTRGTLTALMEGPEVWEHHSSNSRKYNNVIGALKDYHEALSANDGGKIQDERMKLIKCAMAYVSGKESKRRNQYGQNRFDNVMTLLYEELKPEAFDELIQKINHKRSAQNKVSRKYYQGKKATRMKKVKSLEGSSQRRTEDVTTTIKDFRSAIALSDMDKHYAPAEVQPNNQWLSVYPAIGYHSLSQVYRLSVRDFSALAFSSSLSSSKRKDLLLEKDFLLQSDEAVAEGKRAADIALKNYGEGDKVPLATLLKIGIQKINQEANSKSSVQKECLQEMSSRMLGMLERDPELKKYAMRQGLAEADLKAAREINAPKTLKNVERADSLEEINIHI